jgi:hypothetical protein
MKIRLLSLLILAAMTGLDAGDWGKAPVDKTPIEECVDLGAEISAGYETDFMFYGIRFARDSFWTDLNYTFDGLPVPITVGAWYLNGINGSAFAGGFDQLNLYANAALGTFAGFDVNLGYTHYTFPEFRSNIAPLGGYGELNFNVTRTVGPLDLRYSMSYAMGGGGFAPQGWYHELGGEKTFPLTDSIGLTLGAGVAYTDGYWGPSDWNHYFARVSLPIELNCRTTLVPYIGYLGAPDTWIVDGAFGANSPQSDILHGGVSLRVTF